MTTVLVIPSFKVTGDDPENAPRGLTTHIREEEREWGQLVSIAPIMDFQKPDPHRVPPESLRITGYLCVFRK